MPRGYRGLIVAIAGLVLAAASPNNSHLPKQAEQRNQADAAAQTGVAANTIAAAISNTVGPPEYQASCEQGNDQRDSDLCAQWKAADAANRAAYWAAWSVFIGTVGAGFLVWTFWETRVTGRRELRAYIVPKVEIISGLISENTALLKVSFINTGKTPAVDCQHMSYLQFGAPNEPESFFTGEPPPASSKGYVGAGVDVHFVRTINITQPENIAKLLAGTGELYLWGQMTYRDVFKRDHITTFRLHLCAEGGLGTFYRLPIGNEMT